MEWIHTTVSIRAVFFYTFINPFSTVTRYQLNAVSLFWCKQLKELLKNSFPMPLGNPDDIACIMINDCCDILMSLAIACFINTNTNKVIKSCIWINIKVFLNTFDDRTYCIS